MAVDTISAKDATGASQTVPTVGDQSGAAVEGDTQGTLAQKLRGLNKNIGAVADSAVEGDVTGSIQAKLRGVQKVLGATSDAKVDTDAVGTINAHIRGLVALLDSVINSSLVDAKLAAGENFIGAVGGKTKVVNASFSRPADTTAYAAGDAVTNSTSSPTVITFDGCARANAGTGFITGATLVDSANQATKGSFELWVFDTTVTPDNDNAVFTPSDSELATLVCVIAFDTAYIGDATSGAGGNCVYSGSIVGGGYKAFKCGASSDDLFGLIVVRNAYTPVSSESFTIRLEISQD